MNYVWYEIVWIARSVRAEIMITNPSWKLPHKKELVEVFKFFNTHKAVSNIYLFNRIKICTRSKPLNEHIKFNVLKNSIVMQFVTSFPFDRFLPPPNTWLTFIFCQILRFRSHITTLIGDCPPLVHKHDLDESHWYGSILHDLGFLCMHVCTHNMKALFIIKVRSSRQLAWA